MAVANPKALQYILHTSGYHFPKRADNLQITKLITGEGIAYANGKGKFAINARPPGPNTILQVTFINVKGRS